MFFVMQKSISNVFNNASHYKVDGLNSLCLFLTHLGEEFFSAQRCNPLMPA